MFKYIVNYNIMDNIFDKYKNSGLTGLVNIGNTCYLNSCLQLLSHTYELNNFLDSNKRQLNKNNEAKIYTEWNSLRNMMWSENCTIAPYGFVKSVQEIAKTKGYEMFTGFAQNDVFEFLLFIIDCLHETLKREVEMKINGTVKNNKDILAKKCYKMMQNMYKEEYSEILNIFYGISVTQIKDYITNDILSIAPEPFSILSLSIPKNIDCTIEDCLDEYTNSEYLIDDNQWYNDKIEEKQDAIKNIVFWSLPNVLIIELKRYNNSQQKIHTLVTTPLTNLDLSKYVSGYNSDGYTYDLFGTGNHSGNVYGGHYTANIKNANGKWYSFNDTLINEISENRVITAHTYCLFYRKKNKD
ncbi:ubiquitin specific peptidase C19 [Chrysochromulina ericina virus CeV-01B]|uniref:Ubiquitin specific peptidase C19 n=1 Tax=Chrysochromulina ericina virus CeV-01B TaxID=3070830 RepID=A0A0N9QQZ6_9VIRU|nr:ubiquitin specific peptidase C19 [Chrysochromulina ericina virus]ALH23266.1 ubiquitin specific peptidase C19 [Chrysochromulina ericina virus CeV-01B]